MKTLEVGAGRHGMPAEIWPLRPDRSAVWAQFPGRRGGASVALQAYRVDGQAEAFGQVPAKFTGRGVVVGAVNEVGEIFGSGEAAGMKPADTEADAVAGLAKANRRVFEIQVFCLLSGKIRGGNPRRGEAANYAAFRLSAAFLPVRRSLTMSKETF